VKSSTGMKDHYAYDIGIQKYVAIGAGLQIQAAFLMHLNREYVFGGGEYELSKLFSAEEVPSEIEVAQAEVNLLRRRPHFPAIGLDELINEIDHAIRTPLVVDAR